MTLATGTRARVVMVYSKRHPVPAGAAYVGRPTIFGNPYIVSRDATLPDVLARYEAFLLTARDGRTGKPLLDHAREELAGKDLVCWCAPDGGIAPDDEQQICHAQILARYVNSAEKEAVAS